MDITLEPNRYVVAVSGGVDSVVLLNVLSMQHEVELIIAHYDHGIRGDSAEDAEFVRELAASYGLPFKLAQGKLGADASEALAREKRYEFLEQVRQKHDAVAVITAHHRDDALETVLINVLRGTGRKGLSSLQSGQIVRPLLEHTKSEIVAYAKAQKLIWREDPSNKEERYTRNKIRAGLQKVDKKDIDQIANNLQKSRQMNAEMDAVIGDMIKNNTKGNSINRVWFIALPYAVSCEVMASWLRKKGREFDKKDIARLVRAMKVAGNNTRHDVDKNYVLVVQNKQISLEVNKSV